MATPPVLRQLVRARDLADARYRDPLTVADLAAAAHMSAAHFSREFKRAFGETPHQYLLTRRLERAAALLRTTDWSVADISFAVGAQSVGSFTTSFGRIYGRSPAEYRSAGPPPASHVRIPHCVAQAYARRGTARFEKTERRAPPSLDTPARSDSRSAR